MKNLLSHRKTRLLVLAGGILGLALRVLLMSTGLDEKGLLVPGHPAWIGLLLLSAAAAGAILVCIRFIRGSGSYRVSFPPSTLTAIGYVLAAVGALAACHSADAAGPLRFLMTVAAVLVAAAFLVVALCRKIGRKPSFLFHAAICVHFALQALTLYRTWSFDPQLQDYCFQLFACIALTMTAYRLAMFDTGKGSHRRLWLWGLAAIYLCCVSMSSGLFYITGAFWAFTALSHLRRRRPHRQAEPDPEDQEAAPEPVPVTWEESPESVPVPVPVTDPQDPIPEPDPVPEPEPAPAAE